MIIKYDLFTKHQFDFKKKFYLLYGINTGKIESCINIYKKILKTCTNNISYLNFYSDDLTKDNFKEIIEKNNHKDLFGNNFSLIFSLNDLKLSSEILKYIDPKLIQIQSIIFKSGPIQKNIKFRKFFEESNECICVPCYEETLHEKIIIIQDFFQTENLTIEYNDAELLAIKLSNERLNLLNDLEKIIFFLKTTNKKINEVTDILSQDYIEDINKLVFSLASKNKNVFWEEFFRSGKYFKDEIRFINQFSQHLEKILLVKRKVALGLSIFRAVKSLRPPIFFKFENQFEQQLKIWSELELVETIKKLHLCQASFFKNERSSQSFFYSVLTKIFK